MLRILILVLGTMILAAGSYAAYQVRGMQAWLATPLGEPEKRIVIEITPGASVKSTLKFIAQKGVIRESDLYIALLGHFGPEIKPIQKGEYELSSLDSPAKILEILNEGKVRTYALTFPEGMTVAEIGLALEKSGFGKQDHFTDPKMLEKLLEELTIPYMEGYLFPDTYRVPKGTSQKAIAKMMVENFKRHLPPDFHAKASWLNMTPDQAVIVASIIEKETGATEEMPLISAVIHNRLKKKMRLMMDTTVIYGIRDFNGNLTRADLHRPHPWNTYTNDGFPLTPICNPGEEALKAAVNPANVDYLYFVSMNNGRHKFASTLEEHNKYVRKYQILRQSGD